MEKMADPNKNHHHVAWADRIGLNKTWAKGIERIWSTYGTVEFRSAVWGLRTIIINIKKGPQLRKIIDDQITKLQKERNIKLEPYYHTTAYGSESDILDDEMLEQVAYFMVQTLEDHGFGMYKSEFDGDYDEM